MIPSEVLLWLSASATEALHRAADAQQRYHDQEDDKQDPGEGMMSP